MVFARISSFAERNSLTPYLFYILFTSTLGPLLFGFHLGELNAPEKVIRCDLAPTPHLTAVSLPTCLPTSPLTFGLIQSIFTIGGLCGALAAGPISTSRGRLSTMRINTAFCFAGPALEALSPNIPVMVIGRFLSGIGAGASLVVVPIYISEIAPAGVKGFFGAFTQIMTNVGIFLAQCLGLGLSRPGAWRWILAVAGVVGAVQLVGLTACVESPRWLAERGEGRKAKDALRRIRGKDADISGETKGWNDGSEDEQRSLLASTDGAASEGTTPPTRQQTTSLTFVQILRHPIYPRALLAITLVMVAQQFTGINSIIMYGVSLLSSLLPNSSAQLNVLVSALNIFCTTLFAPLVDILGRKICLLLSITGMTISSVLLGVGIHGNIAPLSAAAVLTFVGSFAVGLGPVPFMLSSELVGADAVGVTQSWALAANWIATGIVAQFFPLINQKLGGGRVYFLFAGLGVAFFVLVGGLVPETKGKDGVEEVWGKRVEDRERMD